MQNAKTPQTDQERLKKIRVWRELKRGKMI